MAADLIRRLPQRRKTSEKKHIKKLAVIEINFIYLQ